ncbi:mitochondrial 37S ribosomal protein MRPS9 [Sugiyamaella lignohabitans]|uniref:Small ribosomal subunit protein uS9m n=1 Tax=Sugiyamaella lignohabitans TaxID=796027 RepID=A0A161HW49_9ASCO|nr:mitochondrial 37S ribosomal protein MRPS9 [Sugiyamaella lignohabitans]ANB13053.1 mitochondrial 37S ribosomal protein MRPS9 [Sugiyamaella lignohabitans]
MPRLRQLVPAGFSNPIQVYTRLIFNSASKPFSTTTSPSNAQRAISQIQTRLEKLTKEYEDYNGIRKEQSDEDVRGTNLIKFNDFSHRRGDLEKLRVVPRDQAFYMANPPHEEIMRKLSDLLDKNINLPLASPQTYVRPSWLPMKDYANMAGGTRLRPSNYREFIKLASRLDSIDPQLIPSDVVTILDAFKRKETTASNKTPIKVLDNMGRAIAVGRRKTSSARVIVVKASEEIKGQFLVNGRPLDVHFDRLQDRTTALFPLKVIEGMGSYNVFATVHGGGLTGQCGAIALGLTKALIIHNPILGKRLSKAGCTKRDTRVKERKKPGKPKARKSNTWVKR